MSKELTNEEIREKYGLYERTLIDRMREHWVGYLLISPTLIGFIALFYFPLINGIRISLLDYNIAGGGDFIGIENYIWVATNDLFISAFQWTVAFVFGTTTLQLVVGLTAALCLNEIRSGLREWLGSIIMAPFFSAALVGGVIWMWMLTVNFGLVNWVLESLDMSPIYFLSDGILPYISLIIAQTWHDYAYAAIIYLPALQGIPKEQYEAAAIDGAGLIQRFRDVTLPHLLIPTVIILAMRTAFNFAEFAQPFMLTGGGPGTRTMLLSILVYRTAFVQFQFGRAYVIGIILMILSLGSALIYIISINQEEELYI